MKILQKLNLISFLKEEVIGSENTFHAWCVLAAIGAILGMGLFLHSPAVSFHGIASSDVINVNFEYPVEIRRVHVISGQKVSRGDLLVELEPEQHMDHQRRYVLAEIDGVVGNVNFQKGERAAAFAPLVSISPESPTYVKGYVHESLRAKLEIGMYVKIHSVTGSDAKVEGKVVSLGARFVEIPTRLKPALFGNQGSGSWGREVVVQISAQNPLLMGEKVMISPADSFLRSFVARAEHPVLSSSKPEMKETMPVRVAPAIAAKSRIELSGAIYLEDLKKYLVVSDDTDEGKRPLLFLMSDEGELEEDPLLIPGLPKLKELESISNDGEYTYVMSALWGKGHALDKAGGMFVRFHRHGLHLSNTQALVFTPLLRKLLEKSHDPEVIALVSKGIEHLEVEAHAVLGGDLYVGLKAPRAEGKRSVIIKIPDVNGLFAGALNSRAEVWKTLRFPGDEDDHRISDMTFVDDSLYVTTTRKKEPGGAFWTLRKIESEPKLVRSFAYERPEGVAYNSKKNEFMIVFDQAAAGSRYFVLSGPHSSSKE